MPKKYINFMECEVQRGLRITGKSAEWITFKLPRKSGDFQEDLYPPCEAGKEALTYEEWAAGQNVDPIMQNFDPSSVGVSQTTIDRQTTFKKLVSKIKNDPVQEMISPGTANSTSSSQADVLKIKTLESKVKEQADTISNFEKVINELRAKVEALESPPKPDTLAWPQNSF
jgi:coronin-1B/1C/6